MLGLHLCWQSNRRLSVLCYGSRGESRAMADCTDRGSIHKNPLLQVFGGDNAGHYLYLQQQSELK